MDLTLPISLSNTYKLICNKVELVQPDAVVDVGEKLTNANDQISTLNNQINNNYVDLNNKINTKQNILSSYEPADQDVPQLSFLHSSTKLSKITWDSSYFNFYKHDNPADERFGLLDLRLTTTFLTNVNDKYTQSEILNISTLSNYNTKITTSSLLNTKQNLITGGCSSVVTNNLNGLKICTSDSAGKITTSPVDASKLLFLSDVTSNIQAQIGTKLNISDGFTRTEILNISTLSNYNTKTTTTSILNSYYTKADTLNISTLSNYNTKTTTTSILNNYYTKADTLNISGLTNYFVKSNVTEKINQCVFDYVPGGGHKLFDVTTVSGFANNYFYTVAGGVNTSITRDTVNKRITIGNNNNSSYNNVTVSTSLYANNALFNNVTINSVLNLPNSIAFTNVTVSSSLRAPGTAILNNVTVSSVLYANSTILNSNFINNVTVASTLSSPGTAILNNVTVTSSLRAPGTTILNNVTVNTMFNAPGSIYLTSTRCIIGNAQIQTTPTTSGIQLGLGINDNYGIQIAKSTGTATFIDFTDTSNDYLGRILYNFTDNTLKFFCNGALALTMNSTGLPDYFTKSVIYDNYDELYFKGIVDANGTILADYGQRSFTVTKVSTGRYRINFDQAIVTTNYFARLTAYSTGTIVINQGVTQMGYMEVHTAVASTGAAADCKFSFLISR